MYQVTFYTKAGNYIDTEDIREDFAKLDKNTFGYDPKVWKKVAQLFSKHHNTHMAWVESIDRVGYYYVIKRGSNGRLGYELRPYESGTVETKQLKFQETLGIKFKPRTQEPELLFESMVEAEEFGKVITKKQAMDMMDQILKNIIFVNSITKQGVEVSQSQLDRASICATNNQRIRVALSISKYRFSDRTKRRLGLC